MLPNKTPPTCTKTYKYILLILIWLCGYLLFQGLANNYFWDDESYTAMFARNLLKFGNLTAWNGRNLIAYINGQELNNHFINIFIPQLQCYLTALSFYFFGISTLTARLPFALIGLLSIFILMRILKELNMNSIFIALAVLIYISSPSFLLYSRQCRYYALVIFLSLCIYYFYLKLMRSNQKTSLIFFMLTGGLLFYTHTFSFVCFFLSLIITHLIYNRGRINIQNYILIFVSFFIFIIAYTLHNNSFLTFKRNIPKINIPDSWASIKLQTLYGYMEQLNTAGWLPWIIAFGLICFLVPGKKKSLLQKLGREWLTLTFLFVFFAGILIPKEFLPANRYIIILLPFFAGLTAFFLHFVLTKSKLLFVLFLPLIIFTNFFAINPLNPKLTFPILDYIHAIHNNYITPYEAITLYLKENAQQDDLVYIAPHYMNFPIMFYTDDQLIFCGLLDKNSYLPPKKIEGLNNALFIENAVPDWIIICGRYNSPSYLLNRLDQQNIKYYIHDILNIYWEDFTRPESQLYHYEPIKYFNPSEGGILILKKFSKTT